VRFGWGERKKDFGGAVEGGSEMAPAASSTIFSMLSPCEHVFSAPYASKEQQWQQQHPSTQGPRNLLCQGVEIVSLKKSSSQGSLLDCRQQIWGVALPASCRRCCSTHCCQACLLLTEMPSTSFGKDDHHHVWVEGGVV
jgi:hypothetical protein